MKKNGRDRATEDLKICRKRAKLLAVVRGGEVIFNLEENVECGEVVAELQKNGVCLYYLNFSIK